MLTSLLKTDWTNVNVMVFSFDARVDAACYGLLKNKKLAGWLWQEETRHRRLGLFLFGTQSNEKYRLLYFK